MNRKDTTPSVVHMYAATTGIPERVAEFRWSATTGVTLQIFEDMWGRLALQYYEKGVPDQAGDAIIPRTDGEKFMKALASLRAGSYYSFSAEQGNDTA